MAVGGIYGQANRILRPHGPRPGPQAGFTGLQRALVHEATHTPRALLLSRIPKRSHTWFGNFHGPSHVQRFAPNLAYYGPDYRYVRETLVARSRLVRTAMSKTPAPVQGTVPVQVVRGSQG